MKKKLEMKKKINLLRSVTHVGFLVAGTSRQALFFMLPRQSQVHLSEVILIHS